VTLLQIFGITGIAEIVEGDDLATAIVDAAAACGNALHAGDIVVVTSKVVSKAEGRTVELADVEPSRFAVDWSARWDKDAAVTEVVLREARRVVRQSGPSAPTAALTSRRAVPMVVWCCCRPTPTRRRAGFVVAWPNSVSMLR
jgi:F420-0:gamma-glutamyl ligase